MCYSTQQGKPLSELEKRLNAVAKLPDHLDREDLTLFHANGFAHPVMVVLPQENRNYLAPLMWGFIPSWENGARAKEYYAETIKYGSGLNAKSEKLFTSRMYLDSAQNKRCIIPVTGFFEPHTTAVKVKGKAFKVPFFFERKDKEIVNLAGIYSITKDGYATFTILTKAATPLFAKIHNGKNRRPVLIKDEDIDTWLRKDLARQDIEHIIASDMADDAINTYPISKDLYNPSVVSNVPEISTRVAYKEVTITY